MNVEICGVILTKSLQNYKTYQSSINVTISTAAICSVIYVIKITFIFRTMTFFKINIMKLDIFV